MKITKVIISAVLLLAASLALATFFLFSTKSVYSDLSHQPPIDLTSGQRNTLLVVVNDGEDFKPELRSVWLILELPDKQSLTLIPLYPGALKNYAVHDQVLEQTFAIIDNHHLNESFLSHLTELNIWWNDFVLVDDFIVGNFFEMTNGSTVAGLPVTAEDIQSGNYPAADNKSARLEFQVGLMKYFCQKISLAPLHPSYQQIMDVLPSHAISSLKNNELLARFTSINQLTSAVDCKFPTLKATSEPGSLQGSN